MQSKNQIVKEKNAGEETEKTSSLSEVNKEATTDKIVYDMQKCGEKTKCICKQLSEEEYWARKNSIERYLNE